ncbi:hydrogenase maturation protease [Rhodococcus tukisamuensis]|uniref:Hydrogenase maturation protease n=1 Tax=Rhodococcus tukisamuensis TaxID=168276 RepID=A0A1G6UNW5_9NOCA|nr:hydrogenase maturation protease [Rhodococcus tukisamuensis]SDD42981.1 hydrogenase maturation protease [Rhodococcus tukisamuensis]
MAGLNRVLVAGIGNIFLGDDGFGPEVLRRLAATDRGGSSAGPAGARLVDYGIRGMHLAYDLLDGWEALVLVDALPDRGAPGTIRVFEADVDAFGQGGGLDAHGMDPGSVFAGLAALGGTAPRTIVVGCEVRTVEEGIGLSPEVESAVDGAVTAVLDVLAGLTVVPDGAAARGEEG